MIKSKAKNEGKNALQFVYSDTHTARTQHYSQLSQVSCKNTVSSLSLDLWCTLGQVQQAKLGLNINIMTIMLPFSLIFCDSVYID